ncbi:MAG: hypothetical protein U0V70_05520 [Terriglobia bacterium]
MSSDSQNSNPDFSGNVVPIRTGDDASEVERKLVDARRLFSLHEYSLCEQAILEVLAADPHNTKAKALLELTSIKLAKRKLYKKMVDPRLTAEPPSASLSSDPLPSGPQQVSPSGKREAAGSGPERNRVTPLRRQEKSPASFSRSRPLPPASRPRRSAETSLTTMPGSMREQTIAAMVELLRDRSKDVGEWKSLQRGNTALDRAAEVNTVSLPEPVPFVPVEETGEGSLETAVKATPEIEPESAENQQHDGLPMAVPAEAKSSLRVDFLPESLSDLFDPVAETSPPPRLFLHEETPTQAVQAPPSQVPSGVQEPLTKGNKEAIPLHKPAPENVPVSHPPLSPTPVSLRPPLQQVSKDLPKEVILTTPITLSPKQASPHQEVGSERSSTKDIIPSPEILEMPSDPLPSSSEIPPPVVRLPGVKVFDSITSAREMPPQEIIDRKLEQRSAEIYNSEIKAVSIAQIKKYLYQEQYDLCSQELDRIRVLFPHNPEIQAFVENTSRRLGDLKAMKSFEVEAATLMRTAVSFYQEGKFSEALMAAREVLQVNPNHTQAREFVEFVRRRSKPERKSEPNRNIETYCQTCGTSLDSNSQFCHHCGKRLF